MLFSALKSPFRNAPRPGTTEAPRRQGFRFCLAACLLTGALAAQPVAEQLDPVDDERLAKAPKDADAAVKKATERVKHLEQAPAPPRGKGRWVPRRGGPTPPPPGLGRRG